MGQNAQHGDGGAGDPRTSPAWRDAWDHAAADAQLTRIDARQKVLQLAAEREGAEKRCRHLFGEIVRERTFYQLDRRLSAAIKAALVEFVRALAPGLAGAPARRHGCTDEPHVTRWSGVTARFLVGSCPPGGWPSNFQQS